MGLRPSFCWVEVEGTTRRVKGGRGVGSWTRDVEGQMMVADEERREVPARRAWFCHVAYMHTCRKDIEKYTPVLSPHRGNDLDTS